MVHAYPSRDQKHELPVAEAAFSTGLRNQGRRLKSCREDHSWRAAQCWEAALNPVGLQGLLGWIPGPSANPFCASPTAEAPAC
jgi:hypothetical protein